MHILTLTSQISFSLLIGKTLEETERRILERGEYVLKTRNNKKFSNACILRYARKNNFAVPTLERLIDRMRYRRQCLLKAAWIKPFSIKRWFRFQRAAKKMQTSLEELFIEFYRYSGDPELLEIISHVRFVDGHLIRQMLIARRKFEK